MNGQEQIGLVQRDHEHPLEKLTDEELATLGALGGIAPYFRGNIEDQLHVLGRLAGLEENRRMSRETEVQHHIALGRQWYEGFTG